MMFSRIHNTKLVGSFFKLYIFLAKQFISIISIIFCNRHKIVLNLIVLMYEFVDLLLINIFCLNTVENSIFRPICGRIVAIHSTLNIANMSYRATNSCGWWKKVENGRKKFTLHQSQTRRIFGQNYFEFYLLFLLHNFKKLHFLELIIIKSKVFKRYHCFSLRHKSGNNILFYNFRHSYSTITTNSIFCYSVYKLLFSYYY